MPLGYLQEGEGKAQKAAFPLLDLVSRGGGRSPLHATAKKKKQGRKEQQKNRKQRGPGSLKGCPWPLGGLHCRRRGLSPLLPFWMASPEGECSPEFPTCEEQEEHKKKNTDNRETQGSPRTFLKEGP